MIAFVRPQLKYALMQRAFSLLILATGFMAGISCAQDSVKAGLEKDFPGLFTLYKEMHSHPELSSKEEKTSQRVAEELERAGFAVTTRVGGYGVVGVMKNGKGPTILVRADLDGLPVKEQTGLPYASTVVAKDDKGNDVPVMHACGHDLHIAAFIGTAKMLARLRESWSGTLVFIGQPAEEKTTGATAMLRDGLFRRFPKPDYCLALHDNAELPAGSVGYVEGFALANVDSADITVHGVGGHGAYPHKSKDPIVLASQIILALQTIVSREVQPGDPAVVTVGSIHGGTKHNIIPDEVKLQLTLRSYSEAVRQQTIAAVKRIVRGQASSAGIPENRMPDVTFGDDPTPATYNDPDLTRRLAEVWRRRLGPDNVITSKPVMGAEDFGQFGRTPEKIPICIFWVGAVKRERFDESQRTSQTLPSLHSPFFAPDPEPAIKTAVTAMVAAVLELAKHE